MSPYIKKERREVLDVHPDQAETTGELTYLLCREVNAYIEHKGKSFQNISECIAALESAKIELSRRVLAKYEDGKLLDHGDVWTVG
jgi:hypothetical protein